MNTTNCRAHHNGISSSLFSALIS